MSQASKSHVPAAPPAEPDLPRKAAARDRRALVNLPVALGFGCFFAWKEALVAFLYPPSCGLVLSPLVCQAFACCLVLLVAVLVLRRNRAGFSPSSLRVVAGVLMVLATVAGCAVTTAGAGVLAYVASAVVGCATAVLLYGWAEVLANVDLRAQLGTVVAGLCVASACGVAVGQCALWTMNAAVAVLGALGFVGFAVASTSLGGRDDEPLMIRPTSSNHFRMLLCGVVLYALVFGVVSGTTAAIATEATTHDFTLAMSQAMLLVTAAVLAFLLAWGRPAKLSTVGRLLTPVLAILLLLHILIQGSANGWLPRLTLGFWQIVQVFVLLLLINVARGGLASLSFVFPLGWAIVSLGYAVGVLSGHLLSNAYGIEPQAVQSIAVSLTIAAVLASSVMSSARYPGVVAPSAAEPIVPRADDAPSPPAADPIAVACAHISSHHAISDREAEVLELLARGNTRASIAQKLCISENTARVHVKNIYAKLCIHSKQQLIDMVDRRTE